MKRWMMAIIIITILLAGCILLVKKVVPHLDEKTSAESILSLRAIIGDTMYASLGPIECMTQGGFDAHNVAWFRFSCDLNDFRAIVAHLAADSSIQSCESGTAEFRTTIPGSNFKNLYLNGELLEIGGPFRGNEPSWWTPADLDKCNLLRTEVKVYYASRPYLRRYYLFHDESKHRAYLYADYYAHEMQNG